MNDLTEQHQWQYEVEGLQKRIAELEQQLQQAEARVAELEARLNRYPADVGAYILRKQAEAVDDFGNVFDRMHRMVASRKVAEDSFEYADRLRQQADELEKERPHDR